MVANSSNSRAKTLTQTKQQNQVFFTSFFPVEQINLQSLKDFLQGFKVALTHRKLCTYDAF